jgi:hypothetical protein
MKPLQIDAKKRRVKLRLAAKIYSQKALIQSLKDYQAHLVDAQLARKPKFFQIDFCVPEGANPEFLALSLANHCLALTQALG